MPRYDQFTVLYDSQQIVYLQCIIQTAYRQRNKDILNKKLSCNKISLVSITVALNN